MKFVEIYRSNVQAVKSSLTSLWCSEAFSEKQKGYAEQLKKLVKNELFASEEYDPLVQSMEPYKSSTEKEAEEIFKKIDKSLWKRCIPKDKDFTPYLHQIEAWKSLTEGDCRSMVVTTGTGSGKTECFMVPLVNELKQMNANPNGGFHKVKAIFLYPLNALMEDQKERLQNLLKKTSLTFAVYNGNLPDRRDGTNDDDIENEITEYENIKATRDDLHRDGVDILLTNPTMLEYMLIRDKDQKLFTEDSLRWIVVDEAHTFTGAAAAELAMLLRRLLLAFNTNKDRLHFAASSATIGNAQDKEAQEESLRKFISDISGISLDKVDVIKGDRVEYVPAENDTKEFVRCKELLTSSSCDYVKLSELLPGCDTIEERLAKLDEFCDKGLRAKVHFFYRVANSGIRVQLDKWEDENRGLLKLQSVMTTDTDATPFLEVARCEHCGEYFAIGETKDGNNGKNHYWAATDADDDMFDLNTDRSNKVFFGVVRTDSVRKPNNEYVSIEGDEYQTGHNPTGNWAIVVNTNKQCPHCSANLYPQKNKGNVANQSPQSDAEDDTKFKATRLRISGEFISRLMAPSLLKHLRKYPGQNGDTDSKPHSGQQYISFVDSRQAAAKGTFNQNVEVERDWVFSRIYHHLVELSQQREITQRIQELTSRIQELERYDDFEGAVNFRRELAELQRNNPTAATQDYLTWQDIYELLSDDPNCECICRQFMNQSNGKELNDDGTINSICRARYIQAVMLSNLAKYPPFQASAETMGLLVSYYPKLERIREVPEAVRMFNEKFNTNIDLEQWRNLLKIYIDRIPRSNESIYLKIENNHQLDIFNCSERFGLQRPPHRTVRKPFLNDKCNNASLVTKLLAQVINPENQDLLDIMKKHRNDINNVVDAMWQDLKECELLQYSEKINKNVSQKVDGTIAPRDWMYDRDSADDSKNIPTEQQNEHGYQLRLNVVDIAFRLPEKVYFCKISERGNQKSHIRPTYTTFCGYCPYTDEGIAAPLHEETWENAYEYINGINPNTGSQASYEEIEQWMRANRPTMYEYGLMGETGCFNNRLLSILSYPTPFIQAEHTAQVEKRLSRKTQEQFKNQEINILACSTTMEMGVDLGNLELVMMSSIPPHPANYKQRAGRSGRNDSARSVCITLCSSDAVGYRVLRDPMETIIQRQVAMPFVDLDSRAIIQRHVNAFLYRKSGIFFSDNNRSSLNWRIIDIFSNYHFHQNTRINNGRRYSYDDYWDVRDADNRPIFPIGEQPLGDKRGTRYEVFSEWLINDAQPADIEKLLENTQYAGYESSFIDKCTEEWEKRNEEIELELVYYGKLYDNAYQEALRDNGPYAHPNRELATPFGRLLRAKYNKILKKRLIEFLATHRFTPNANMPVNIVEFDIYHNSKNLYTQKSLLSNPSYSLQQALSQYAPGNMIVKENRVIKVVGVEYEGKDTEHDRTIFYTDGTDVVTAETRRSIDPANRKSWPTSGRNELELIKVKSFLSDINAQDSRVLSPSPYTKVDAYLVGAEDWKPSGHHLLNARCNLDAGDAQILYYNDGMGYGYCMCPNCGRMALESAPIKTGFMRRIPAEMTSETSQNGFACHYAIDNLDDRGNPKPCNPIRYYRNVIIGGLIQTDFCEMRVKKANNMPATKENDKSLLVTLGLVICRAYTEYIGKDRNSVDFTIMQNGNLCIFDTNPGGSGYSDKLSDSNIRTETLNRAFVMLSSIRDKEELLDKFTIRYLNDLDVEVTKKWIEQELQSWNMTPGNVAESSYKEARWASVLDIIKDFKSAAAAGESGVLFCNEDFEKWNYESNDSNVVRNTWKHRVQDIIKAFVVGPQIDLVIPTERFIPTTALSILPQNGWIDIYTTTDRMDAGFHPLAIVNGHLYFTDESETSSMNGDWGKGSVFCISQDCFTLEEHNRRRVVSSNPQSTRILYLDDSRNEHCNSRELANIVISLAEASGLAIDGFMEYCRNSDECVNITYTDEHLKSVTGMNTTMHFIDSLLQEMGRTDNFHIKFVNEEYYDPTSFEVYQPWKNIEKWERRNDILADLATDWLMQGYEKSEEDVATMWENQCDIQKSMPHWRVLCIECGSRRLNIYPHGGIINEWRVDFDADRRRRYDMKYTKEKIPLVRTKPIMYIVELCDR